MENMWKYMKNIKYMKNQILVIQHHDPVEFISTVFLESDEETVTENPKHLAKGSRLKNKWQK